jgi:hypothetical protein
MVVPDALSRNPMSLRAVEPYDEVEPFYSILGTFSSAVSPVFRYTCSRCRLKLTHSHNIAHSAQT